MESVPVPAGEGDLAVAAKFALESIEVADSAAGHRKKGDRSDSSDAGSSSDDDDSDDDDDAPNARPSTEGAEYEFSDGEGTAPNYPAIIRDGDDSSEWSDSSDEDVEALDMDNMPRWLEDIKNGVDRDLDDDACHAEPPRTKNEIPAETRPPPPPPPPVAPDEAIVPIGDVVSVVGDVVVVQSLPNTPPLDEESILCLETRQGLAAIEEVFGPVAAPLYAFRAPSESVAPSEVSGEGAEGGAEGGADTAVLPDDVKVGTRIYVVEGRSRVIQTAGLYSKGYDNSGQNDEEVDDDEYSDDEKEAEAKKQRKQKKRGADGVGKGGGPSAMRDGGLAAAAAAAGMGAGMPHYGNGPSRFQPKVPPAVQMAHMGIGGTQGAPHPPYAQAPQGAPMMMQTPAGMVPMMPGHQAGGYVQTPQGLVQMVPMMMQPPGAPGQSYYQAPGQTNPPPPPPQ